ncbi:hypothetical protein BDW74DRAFT_175370 [Aspergillus multicolor]|uniref:uncharacterized protein n=1 Tax=Aspergillus multicolor TaxID=41759 RepID=UPI003CCD9CED
MFRWCSSDTKLSHSGYHSWDIPNQTIAEQVKAQKYNLANRLLYNPILAIVKTSVIVFIFRIEDHRPIVRWNLYILFWINLALMISIFLADLFQYTPLHYVYDYPTMDLAAQQAHGADTNGMKDSKPVKGGRCINQTGPFLGSAGLTILTDIWLLCISAIVVWRLQMNLRKKIAIIAILSMGVIVAVIGIARSVIYAHRFRPNNNDKTFNVGHTISGAEVDVAIITASAAALSALVTHVAPRFWSSMNHTSEGQRGVGAWAGSSARGGATYGRRRASYVMMGVIEAKNGSQVSQEQMITQDGEPSTPQMAQGRLPA